MKKALIIASIVAVAFLALVAARAFDQKVIYFQDGRSNSVRSVTSILWGAWKKLEVVFRTPGFDERDAHWEEGVKRVFERPILEGELVVIRKAGRYSFLNVKRINHGKGEIEVEVKSEESPWRKVSPIGDALLFTVPVDGIEVMFSVTNGALYVYSDLYWIKPIEEIYEVSFSKEKDVVSEGQLSQMKFLKFPWDLWSR